MAGNKLRFLYQTFKVVWLIIKDGKIIKGIRMTWQKAVIFKDRFFADIDSFFC